MILKAEPGIEVVGEAADGEEAVAAARRLRPDVVVMDVRMPRVDGLEATRRLLAAPAATDARARCSRPSTSTSTSTTRCARARAGSCSRTVRPNSSSRRIRTVADGGALLAPAVTRRLIEEFARRAPPVGPPLLTELTARERTVLEHLARGLSNAEIAAELVLGEATIKTHVARVLSKLGLRDRTQAVVYAYESGLVRPEASR